MKAKQSLYRAGQSPWLDNITLTAAALLEDPVGNAAFQDRLLSAMRYEFAGGNVRRDATCDR